MKAVKIINITALMFLLLGAYGLPVTGALQVVATIIFLLLFPKNKLIYSYFVFVAIFFLLWDGDGFNCLFIIPFFLIIFLTYIIYTQKPTL